MQARPLPVPADTQVPAGLPLHGHTVTDATYWRRANKDLTQARNVGPWLKLPGWKRRLYRTGPVVAIAALMIDLTMTAAVLAALLVYVIARRTSWGRRLARRAVSFLLTPLRTQRVSRLLDRRPMWLRTPRHRNRIQTMGMLLARSPAPQQRRGGRDDWTPDYAATEPGEEVARWVLPRGFKARAGRRTRRRRCGSPASGWRSPSAGNLDADEPVLVIRRAREMPVHRYLNDVLDKLDALDDRQDRDRPGRPGEPRLLVLE